MSVVFERSVIAVVEPPTRHRLSHKPLPGAHVSPCYVHACMHVMCPHPTLPPSPPPLPWPQLLALGSYDQALQLAHTLWRDQQLREAMQRAVSAMAAACVRLQTRDTAGAAPPWEWLCGSGLHGSGCVALPHTKAGALPKYEGRG